MAKCDCYFQHGLKFLCYGTKEMEECSCGGDKSKCDFYPEKRKQKMANEKRLIDANEMKNNIMEAMMRQFEKNGDQIALRLAEMMWHFIDVTDTVDAVEVVHGRWEQVQRWATKAKYRCSVCGREIMSATKVNIEKYPYCHCGAKMDGDGNG